MAEPAYASSDKEIAIAFKKDGTLLNLPINTLRLKYPSSFYMAATGEIKAIIPNGVGVNCQSFGGDTKLRNKCLDKMRDREEVCAICHSDILKNILLNVKIETRFLKCTHICK